jgi:hypothetical protein
MSTSEAADLTLDPGAERGGYVLSGADVRDPTTLTVASWRSRADANVRGVSYELVLSGLRDRGVSTMRHGTHEPVVRLGKVCVVPGAVAASWKVRTHWRGYRAELDAGGLGRISARLGWRGSSAVGVEVRGSFPDRDLLALTVAFALLRRRRDDGSAGGVSGAGGG